MNQFLNKLEKKWGQFAIQNLILYLMIGYGIGYFLYYTNQTAYDLLVLYPDMVMKGQIWRLFTWILTVPEDLTIWSIFFFAIFYMLGQNLERYWGTFRFNLYVFSGIFLMTIGTMIAYLVFGVASYPSTYYIYMSMFFAFATCFPDMQLLLMGIIPVKIKWLAILDGLLYIYNFITVGELLESCKDTIYEEAARSYVYGIRLSIVLSFLNFIIFFFATRNYKRIAPSEVKRRRDYKKQMSQAQSVRHKCAICGRTEDDGEDLVFRYCSKCKGGFEYCQDHLFTHEHR